MCELPFIVVSALKFIYILTFNRTWMNVTLFNELGDSINKILGDKQEDDMVIVISAANIHKFDGKWYFCNFYICMD